LRELGVESSGVDSLIRSAYRLLGLMSFLTAGEKEVRAWTIPRGTRAPQAAGVIHSDIERGFIRAEVISYEDLMRAGSYAAAREQGLLRLEGKDYVMQEGDVAHFRFNV
jgi:ribosome-binding ATPase YchF (GTP1/OBG family)